MARSNKYAYPDLENADFLYKALLGYGMFAEKLPPCFSSIKLSEDLPVEATLNAKSYAKSYVTYSTSRNTNVARSLAIPHPESYLYLCKTIKDNWENINEHIGKPEVKFSFCHVRKITNKNHIFEMNYEGSDKWQKSELEQDYLLGCTYIVKADISNCFPSMYSHSIPWAIQEKNNAKANRCTTNKGNKTHWSNDIDREIRNCKDGETNGLLIGPHASNIISEIILIKVDQYLQDKGFQNVIRYIDDYVYFAKDEADAFAFIKCLELGLKKYELSLNQKKTKVISLIKYLSDDGFKKLSRFHFPEKLNDQEIGFPTINSYLDYAISLANETGNFATITYAIKVIAKKKLSSRAKRLYVKKILSLSLIYPYLCPLLEEYVFCFIKQKETEEESPTFDVVNFKNFLNMLFTQSIKKRTTDALAFCFFYSIKYDYKIEMYDNWAEDVIELDDCISILLAWKYLIKYQNFSKKYKASLKKFDTKATSLTEKREQQQFWIFLYEYSLENNKKIQDDSFLEALRKIKISFLNFEKQ
jgi:hypothetical protein